MGKRSVSTSRISVHPGQESVTVTIKNANKKHIRHIKLNVYDQDSEKKEMLPVYFNDNILTEDTMEPLEEKNYQIDVSNVNKKIVFQIIQEDSGSGMKMGVSKGSNRSSKVEFQIK